jgi:hypothetical protein
MKLRTGKYKYTSPRHFDEFRHGNIVVKCTAYMLCLIPLVDLLEMRNKNSTTQTLRGFPRYMAIEPNKKEFWFYPTPDKSYEFTARVMEMFDI